MNPTTVDEIHAIVSKHVTGEMYDGAISHDSSHIPYKYLSKPSMLRYLKIWGEHEDEINRDIREGIEFNCPENPEKKFVSKDWIPFAEFNGGSHFFVVVNQGSHLGKILGIYDGPYGIVKVADNLEQFIALGASNLAHVL